MKKSFFDFKVNLSHLISFFGMIGAIAVMYGQFKTEFTYMKRDIDSNKDNIAAIVKSQEQIARDLAILAQIQKDQMLFNPVPRKAEGGN